MSGDPSIAAALERAWLSRRGPPDTHRADLIEAAAAAGTDPAALGALAVMEALAAQLAGDLPTAWSWIERVSDVDLRWRTRGAAVRGSLQFEREGPRESAATLRAALEASVLDPTISEHELAFVRNDLGRALFHDDALAEADDLFARALDGFVRAGDRRAQAVSLTNRATVRSVLGDVEGALGLYRVALAVSDEPRGRALAWTNLAVVHERLGDGEQALHACRQALAVATDPSIRVRVSAHAAHLLMDQDEVEEARAVVAAAKSAGRDLSPAHLGTLAAASARVQGPTPEAMAELDAALQALPERAREERVQLLLHRAGMASAVGDHHQAVVLLEPLLSASTDDRAVPYGPIGATLGAALEAIGAFEQACAVYRRVAELREHQAEAEARWRVRQLSVLLRVDELERREQEAVATAVGTTEALVRSDRERRLLEEQLRHSQRLEATGRLAAAVAHDFNNLLAVVLVCLDALAVQLPPPLLAPGSLAGKYVDDARAAAERGAALSRSLLASGRRAPVTLGVVDAARVVGDAASLVGRMRADVTVRVDTARVTRRVLADPTLLDQVVVNLCLNAMDAMPGGGLVEVRVCDRDRGGAPGVRIEVQDAGSGIPPELLERIFEPFFTTRPAGIGTGLGLAIVRGIVYQLGGTVDVRSTVGAGSCFGVWLPAGPQNGDAVASA